MFTVDAVYRCSESAKKAMDEVFQKFEDLQDVEQSAHSSNRNDADDNGGVSDSEIDVDADPPSVSLWRSTCAVAVVSSQYSRAFGLGAELWRTICLEYPLLFCLKKASALKLRV